MATIVKRKNKRGVTYAVQVVGLDGKRVTFGLGHLGKIDKADARPHARQIERLLLYRQSNETIPLERSTIAWVEQQRGTKLHEQLAKAGLVDKADRSTLGEWVETYIASITPTVKPTTIPSYRNVERNLIACFGADKQLASFHAGDGDTFNQFLRSDARASGKSMGLGLSDATARRRIGLAGTIFDAAIRRNLLTINPFKQKHIPTTVNANDASFHFVSLEDYQAILDAAPDHDWRCIIALSRFVGVRGMSEIVDLKWTDVLWDKDRIKIMSPKTAHHPGGAFRFSPLFPELRAVLQDAFDVAPVGTVYVVNRYRRPDQNIRTTFNKIVLRAGLKPWPKPFVNMRASRAIELRQLGIPEYMCEEWLGHDSKTAAKHYCRVMDADYSCAAKTLSLPSANRGFWRTDAQNVQGQIGDSKELRGVGSKSGKERWARQDSNL